VPRRRCAVPKKRVWDALAVPPEEWTEVVAAEWGYRFALLNKHLVLPFHFLAGRLAQQTGLAPKPRDQLHKMMLMLEAISRRFMRPGPVAYAEIPAYQGAIEQIAVIAEDLAQWDGDGNREAMEVWEQLLEIAAQDKDFFRELVTVVPLDGKANWTQAKRPRAYLLRSIRNQKVDEDKELAHERRRKAPLEEYLKKEEGEKEPSGETATNLDTIRELLLADTTGDVRRYGAKFFENPEHAEICQDLHWSRERGRRARRAWMAHVHRAAGSLPVREALAQLSADASRTVLWRTFFDRAGRKKGYWEHKPPREPKR
jgi:hypothetical protein